MSKPATRAEVITTLGIVLLVVGFVVSKPVRRSLSAHPSPDACAALLDRYVEHIIHAIDEKPPASELATRKAQARTLASTDPTFARCPTYLTVDEAECAMRANNADEFERCLP
ncbi:MULTISPECIES: hypothetical protein [Polyangium]|uniref:Uncharacterized protein n=2 Tax=Polyangium TaxID=55 RepID=A0A4U1JDI8_9BACT|nr:MULTISPECIES: hypothetical protein [Polyangium]MDI1429329.1 hypothetical protein [Polyangium sorediatum]TKD08892.1 hypothetical protein E8A74_13975 [Polyangium fumosum]